MKMNKLVMIALVALLCVTMVFTATVMAAEGNVARIGEAEYATLAEAVDAADEGDEIVLLGDVDLGTEMLTVKKQVTINLNGKNITSAYEGDYAAIYVGTAGDLTITGEGTITAAEVAIGNYGKVTILGGTISGEAALYNYYYNETTFGVAVISGGQLDNVWNCGDMTVSGGEIAYLDNTHKLTVTDGTIGELVIGEADYAPVGGTSATVAEGTVQNTNAVARIGNTYYTTLAEAVDAADEGDEIVLLGDVDLGTEMLTVKKQVTINLNGKNITSAYEGDYAAIYVGTAGDLTITGEGTITAAEVAIGNYGKVTILGGTISGEAALYNYYYNETTFGVAVISGGQLDNVWNCGDMTVSGGEIAYLDNTHKLTVTDGTIGELVIGEADYAPVGGTSATVAEGTVQNTNAVARIGNTYYTTLADAIAAVGAGDVVIELLADATMDYNAREAFGAAETTSLTINGNDHTLTLNQKNSDWSSFGLANAEAKLVLNDMTIEKTGYGDTSGAWNTHAINFTSYVEMNDVTVNNSVAVRNGAALNNVTINEANGYYGLWIEGNGQTVNVTDGAINATNGGRGIKIADQYVDSPAVVTLNVTGTVFNTAKKAAVLVSSTAGAKITASDVDINAVAADSVSFVWVDEDWAAYYGNVEADGATVAQESAEEFAAEVKRDGETVGYFKTLAEAVEAAAEGDEIVLFKAVVVGDGETLTIDKNVTITTSVTDVFTVNAGGTLNLGAVTVNSTSSILWANGGIINIDGATLTATGSPYAVAFSEKEGQINLKSGTIESKNSNSVTIDVTDENTTLTISGGKVLHDSSSAIAARNKAVVNINGGEVKTTAEEAYCAAFATSGAEIIVSGGEISAANDYGVIAAADGKVTISGGTVDGVLAHENANASAVISGGIINGSVTAANDATVTVTGGSFEQDATVFCDADHHTVKGEDDRYIYGAHAFDNEWATDATNHWHECDCGAIANLGEHTYEEGSCTDCGMKDSVPPTGDSVLVPVVVIMMLSVAAIVVLNKKRVIA